MTHRKQNASLDEVLAEYAGATERFDAKVLQEFVEQYPDFAPALHRHAQFQLASVRATESEIAAEVLSEQEMLPLRNKLLERMRFLPDPPTRKLEAISGERGLRAAAIAVFGACQHGEDMLLILIKDAPGIRDAPGWVYDRLAKHIDAPPPRVRQSLPLRRQGHAQHYRGKPVESAPMSWADAVAACISDETTRRLLLDKAEPLP